MKYVGYKTEFKIILKIMYCVFINIKMRKISEEKKNNSYRY